jgi:hypothetical protein
LKGFPVSTAAWVRMLALLIACGATVGCAADLRHGPHSASKVASLSRNERPIAPFRLFSPSSFWNRALPADAPLDPRSSAIVALLAGQIAGRTGINTTNYSVPIYTVSAHQPLVKVALVDPSRAPGGAALAAAWRGVPLPPNAQPAVGSDKQLVVWQPRTDRLWEFWELNATPIGWQAEWGGALTNASSNSGVYGPGAWPGATRFWGASASSLSIAGGLITLEDLTRGDINHALAMAIPDPRAGVYASPAERTDGGSTDPLSLPEGAHLRLDPRLNLSVLHLPRLTLMIARAAQRYGIIIRDTAQDATLYAQDPTNTGSEPYSGTHGYYEGKSAAQLLASFPWSHLQLLKMTLHTVRG